MKTLKQIVFTKPHTAEYLTLRETDFSELRPDQVVVKTFFSTVSAGTERANYIGEQAVSIDINFGSVTTNC